jgi:dTDP-4-amino-4,6-dideoxygalactose transaminase
MDALAPSTRSNTDPLGFAPQTLLMRTLSPHRQALLDAMAEVVDSGCFVMGAQCESFESDLAATLGVEHVVGVSSGTDALALALAACGVQHGDSVITPSLTASAGGAAIRQVGGVPVFADVDPERLTVAPAAVCEAFGRCPTPPRAIVAVHLHGQPADVAALRKLADDAGVRLIEDCAQALGASVGGVSCGSWGDAAAASFYPTKNLGALGDAGAVLTRNPAVALRARRMREYGWSERQLSVGWGINGRLDEIQAACLRVLLPHLADENRRRQAVARILDQSLDANAHIAPPPFLPDARSVYHQYVVRTPRRDGLARALGQRGIQVARHPPFGLHEQPAYAHGGDVELPETDRALREILSLPLSPVMTDAEAHDLGAIVVRAAAEAA